MTSFCDDMRIYSADLHYKFALKFHLERNDSLSQLSAANRSLTTSV